MPEHIQVRPKGMKKGELLNFQVWLCVLNRENFEVLSEKKVYGIPENKRALTQLEKVKIGDTLLFYVISPVKRIMGVSSAVSTVFIDKRKSPWKDRLYPYRIKVSAVQKINVRMADFVGKLEGVKGRVPMGASLILLSRNDLEIINSLSDANYRQAIGEQQ